MDLLDPLLKLLNLLLGLLKALKRKKIMPINSAMSKNLHWHRLEQLQAVVVRGILAKIREK